MRLQEQTLAHRHPDLEATRAEIARALAGQGKYPLIKVQPLSTRAAIGEKVRFHVDVQRDGPCAYQWFWNGRPVAGSTEPTLEIDKTTKENLGRYHVEIQSLPPDPDVDDPVRSESAFLVEKDYPFERGRLITSLQQRFGRERIRSDRLASIPRSARSDTRDFKS